MDAHYIHDAVELCDAAQQLMDAWQVRLPPTEEECVAALRDAIASDRHSFMQLARLHHSYPALVSIRMAMALLVNHNGESYAMLMFHAMAHAPWSRAAFVQLLRDVDATQRSNVVRALEVSDNLGALAMPDWPCSDDAAFVLSVQDAGMHGRDYRLFLTFVLRNFVPDAAAGGMDAAELDHHVKPLFARLADDGERMAVLPHLLRTMTFVSDDLVTEFKSWVHESHHGAIDDRCDGANANAAAAVNRARITTMRENAKVLASRPDQIARDDDDVTCKVCRDNIVTVCPVVCGHAVCCSDCFSRLPVPKQCPTCRAHIDRIIAWYP